MVLFASTTFFQATSCPLSNPKAMAAAMRPRISRILIPSRRHTLLLKQERRHSPQSCSWQSVSWMHGLPQTHSSQARTSPVAWAFGVSHFASRHQGFPALTHARTDVSINHSHTHTQRRNNDSTRSQILVLSPHLHLAKELQVAAHLIPVVNGQARDSRHGAQPHKRAGHDWFSTTCLTTAFIEL